METTERQGIKMLFLRSTSPYFSMLECVLSGLGTKFVVVRGLWNAVLLTKCDRAVLPKELDEKELDEKEAKLRFQAVSAESGIPWSISSWTR